MPEGPEIRIAGDRIASGIEPIHTRRSSALRYSASEIDVLDDEGLVAYPHLRPRMRAPSAP